MGQDSKIEWTDHTFNPWTGCTKVSPACAHCYAEAWAKRTGIVQWGDSAPRRRTSEANWRQPLIWDREAAKAGVRRRVFCASLADVFEDRDELHAMAQRLGLQRRWFQVSRSGMPHYDICQTKRAQAIAFGAIVIDRRQMVALMKQHREAVTNAA